MPSIRAIRYFLAVAETGGFSRAAAALKIAQPSITNQVQALEGELGVPLLVRHHRGASLTEAVNTSSRVSGRVTYCAVEPDESPLTLSPLPA